MKKKIHKIPVFFERWLPLSLWSDVKGHKSQLTNYKGHSLRMFFKWSCLCLFIGRGMFPHHCNQMSQRSHVAWDASLVVFSKWQCTKYTFANAKYTFPSNNIYKHLPAWLGESVGGWVMFLVPGGLSGQCPIHHCLCLSFRAFYPSSLCNIIQPNAV